MEKVKATEQTWKGLELRQGKCDGCKRAYRWPAKNMKLSEAYCPICHHKLTRTHALLKKYPWYRIPDRPERKSEAVMALVEEEKLKAVSEAKEKAQEKVEEVKANPDVALISWKYSASQKKIGNVHRCTEGVDVEFSTGQKYKLSRYIKGQVQEQNYFLFSVGYLDEQAFKLAYSIIVHFFLSYKCSMVNAFKLADEYHIRFFQNFLFNPVDSFVIYSTEINGWFYELAKAEESKLVNTN